MGSKREKESRVWIRTPPRARPGPPVGKTGEGGQMRCLLAPWSHDLATQGRWDGQNDHSRRVPNSSLQFRPPALSLPPQTVGRRRSQRRNRAFLVPRAFHSVRGALCGAPLPFMTFCLISSVNKHTLGVSGLELVLPSQSSQRRSNPPPPTFLPHLPHPCLPVCFLHFPSFPQALAPLWVPELRTGEGTVDKREQGYSGGLCSWLG